MLRKTYLPKYYCCWPNSNKFRTLLKCAQSGVINRLAKCVHFANTFRGLDLLNVMYEFVSSEFVSF